MLVLLFISVFCIWNDSLGCQWGLFARICSTTLICMCVHSRSMRNIWKIANKWVGEWAREQTHSVQPLQLCLIYECILLYAKLRRLAPQTHTHIPKHAHIYRTPLANLFYAKISHMQSRCIPNWKQHFILWAYCVSVCVCLAATHGIRCFSGCDWRFYTYTAYERARTEVSFSPAKSVHSQ